MKASNKLVAAGLLVVGLILVNMIASWFPMQSDFTEESLYTLSEGSISLLEKVDEPITMTLYFSKSHDYTPPHFKVYAKQVEDLLRQYERHSNGMIVFEQIDPQPDTDEEEVALRVGLRGQPIPTGGYLFFGLGATQADQEAVIPVFSRDREKFLEYDISQLIFQVQQLDKPKLGIITGIQDLIFENNTFMMGGQQPQGESWYVIDAIKQTYEIERITGDDLPDDIDALLAIYATELSDKMKFNVDQFLLSGKPLFVVEDPSYFIQRMNQQPNPMMGRPPAPPPSQFADMLNSWGISYDSGNVLGDLELGTTVSLYRGKPPVNHPLWISYDSFDEDSLITSQLNQIMLVEPGHFSLAEGSELELSPILASSESSHEIAAQMLTYMQPNQIVKQLKPDSKVRNIAGIIRGKFSTAFPDGEPSDEETEEGAEAEKSDKVDNSLKESTRDGTLVLICDVDFLTDDFTVQKMNLFGQTIVNPRNDNVAMVVNTIDTISGSEDLISLRSKGSASRPFTRLEDMQEAAQKKFQKKMDELEGRLQEVQAEINKLNSEQKNQQSLVASPEVMETINKFRLEEAALKKERRNISKGLREDIESMNIRLAMVNLLLIPVFYIIGSIYLFLKRSKRKQG